MRASKKGGETTGPNPSDRGKSGAKGYIVVDRADLPLAVIPAEVIHHSHMTQTTVVECSPFDSATA